MEACPIAHGISAACLVVLDDAKASPASREWHRKARKQLGKFHDLDGVGAAPGEHVQRWYLRDGIKPAGVAPPYEPGDYKPFDNTTWRMHCELLAMVASVALPRCSSTDKREKRPRCLEGVERMRWEDRVEAVLRVQTWVRLHGLTRRHMGSRWPTPRSKQHFKALRRAAKVDVKDKEAPTGWRELKEELKKEWRAHVNADCRGLPIQQG